MPVPADADRLAVLARRLETARLALWIGSPSMKDQVERLLGGELTDDEADRARAELDTIGGILLGKR